MSTQLTKKSTRQTRSTGRKSITADELCRIIEAGAKGGVSFLKLPEIEIHFGGQRVSIKSYGEPSAEFRESALPAKEEVPDSTDLEFLAAVDPVSYEEQVLKSLAEDPST